LKLYPPCSDKVPTGASGFGLTFEGSASVKWVTSLKTGKALDSALA